MEINSLVQNKVQNGGGIICEHSHIIPYVKF